jgi:cobaltochelatase CobS
MSGAARWGAPANDGRAAMLDQAMKPTEEISVRDVFGIDTDMRVKGFADRTDRVPEIDPTYKFDPDTTLAIL